LTRMRSWRRGRISIAVAAAALALLAAGCGRDDFENDPRPPVPLEVTVSIEENGVAVSPAGFGAGIVNFTISNLTKEPASLEFIGPTDATSAEIPPAGNTILKTTMAEGSYQVVSSIANSRPTSIDVGPERESGQDELLLP
jgi:hypothetical protein